MMNPVYRHSPMRMMGLSSGLDTNAVIQQAMRLQQRKLDSLTRSRTTLQWRRELHTNLREQLSGFRSSFLTTIGPNAMMSSSVYNTSIAEVTGNNANAVTIRTGADSAQGSMTINSISKLAQGARATASNVSGPGGHGISPNARLGDLLGSDFDGESMEVTIGGAAERTITLSRDMTVNDMMRAVNQSGTGVTMTFDQLSDELRIETNETIVGGQTLSREGETLTLSGKVFEALGFIDPGSQNYTSAGSQTFNNAQNAELTINGQVITSHSNSFDFRGINITLNGTFDEEPGVDGKISISVKRDITGAFDKITGFINAYNSLIHRLENLLAERKTKEESTYLPLTDEEKSHMTDKQIEEWEAIAKKGLLRGDAGVQRLVSNLRAAFFESVTAAGVSPSDIGLSTGSFLGGTGGQIVINEERLRAALEEDPGKVLNVFMSGATSSNYKDNGLLFRINDIVGGFINQGSFDTLERLDRSISQNSEQMKRLQDKMWREEERLIRRYAAMETALSKLQSQGDWLAQMTNSFGSQ